MGGGDGVRRGEREGKERRGDGETWAFGVWAWRILDECGNSGLYGTKVIYKSFHPTVHFPPGISALSLDCL